MKNKKISIKTIIIILLMGIIGILVFINLNNKNASINKQQIGKGELTQATSDDSYIKMQEHLQGMENAYSDGYKKGSETTNQTIVLYFGGKEILASDTIYGSTSCSGTWANTAFGPYTVIESVDPKIFSTLRCQGNFWGGSASGNSPGVGIDGGSAVLSFIDTVTGETVYTRNVGGRPYNVTIDLLSLNLTNPFRLQYQSTGHMSTWGDPTGQAYLKEVYLKVRDDYQG